MFEALEVRHSFETFIFVQHQIEGSEQHLKIKTWPTLLSISNIVDIEILNNNGSSIRKSRFSLN